MLAILYFGLHWDASQVLGLFVAYFFTLAADQVQSRISHNGCMIVSSDHVSTFLGHARH